MGTSGAGDEADPVLPGRSPPVNCRCNKYLKALLPLGLALGSGWGGTPQSSGFLRPFVWGAGGGGQESADDSPILPLGVWQVFLLGRVGFPGLSSQGFTLVPNGPDSPAPRMSTFVLARAAT